MATTKKRTNVALADDVDQALEQLAERDNVPKATKASELIKVAIQLEEDAVWDEMASGRDTKSAKFLSHDEAWS